MSLKFPKISLEIIDVLPDLDPPRNASLTGFVKFKGLAAS